MKLILIRHGESIGNTKKGFIAGRSDKDGLTIKGKSQIIRTAWELRNTKIDTIVASPVVRAQETAHIISRTLSLPVENKAWLTELHHGMFEGHYWWEIIHKIPSTWRENREDFNSSYPGGGESMKMLVERIWQGLQVLLGELNDDSAIALVSHQAVIAAIRFCLLHGNPNRLTTNETIEKYVSFIHKTMLSNGGFVTVELDNKLNLINVAESNPFEPIKENKENIQFYVNGHFDTNNFTVESLETASTNSVYKIQNNKSHILKILNENNNEAAIRQTRIYQYLKEKSISVPAIELTDTSEIFYKSPVLVQDYVQGEEQRICNKSHKQMMPKLFAEIFKEMEMIHSIPINEVKDFWYPQIEEQFLNWNVYMLFNCNYTLHFMSEFGLAKDAIHILISQIEELKQYINSENFTLAPIHGDLATGNIINSHEGNNCKLERIIDFEWARIGDPLWDYAYYAGWLQRDEEQLATQWLYIVKKRLSTNDFKILHLYRILFHAWTVRDMIEYKDNHIRKRRGQKSLEILENLAIRKYL